MSRPEGKLYLPLVVGTGVSVAALGGLLLVLTLGSLIGPFRFCAAPLAGSPALSPESLRVELLDPETEGVLAARVEVVGPARLRLLVTNDGTERLTGTRLRVRWNRPARDVALRPTKIGQPMALLAFEAGGDSLELELPALAPRRSLAYTIDLE